nr:MAG TPA: hypothetical protein [Caudoviricetes sp.]
MKKEKNILISYLRKIITLFLKNYFLRCSPI